MSRFVRWVVIGFWWINVVPAMAATLEKTTIRLSRMEAGQFPLPVLVTVKTGGAGTETGLHLQVGNAWVVGGLAEISVENTGLPAGIVPWPGLTVSQVVGREIMFASGGGSTVPSLNQILRHGEWFSEGIRRRFTF